MLVHPGGNRAMATKYYKAIELKNFPHVRDNKVNEIPSKAHPWIHLYSWKTASVAE